MIVFVYCVCARWLRCVLEIFGKGLLPGFRVLEWLFMSLLGVCSVHVAWGIRELIWFDL